MSHIVTADYDDFDEVVDQTAPNAGRLRLYAHTASVFKVRLPSGEIRLLTPVNTYKTVAFGAHVFGAGAFTDLPAILENVPIIQPVVIGDGDAMISDLTTGGFTLSDRGIGSPTSVDILIYLR